MVGGAPPPAPMLLRAWWQGFVGLVVSVVGVREALTGGGARLLGIALLLEVILLAVPPGLDVVPPNEDFAGRAQGGQGGPGFGSTR